MSQCLRFVNITIRQCKHGCKKEEKRKEKRKKEKEKEKNLGTVFVRAIEAFEVKQRKAKRKNHRKISGVCRADII